MLSPDLQKTPQELKARPQWVCFKADKTPINPRTGGNAKADDPATWGEFAQAVKRWETHRDNGINGVGYEFSSYDPYTGIDLDKCRDPETGQLKFCAHVLVDYIQSYTEISPSRTGLHFLIKGRVPPGGNAKGIPCGGKVEMYSRGRYFTMTGLHLEGTPTSIEDRQTELETLHREIFGQAQPIPKDAPPPSPALNLADSEIIVKARAAQNGEKFSRLWQGNITEYDGDDSRADLALCSILAFWTQEPAQIDRVFRQSGLMREKWNRQDYRERTITKALDDTTETYQGPRSKPQAPASSPAPQQSPTITPGFHLTDLGNAQRLVTQHGQDLRYCYPWGKWLVWDGTRWIKDESGQVDLWSKETVRSIYAEAGATEEKALREAVADHARRSESDAKRQAMINSARSEPAIPILPEHLDRDPWLLNVLNGTLNLKTGKLQPHRREGLISKLAPVEYDPEAECPGWWKFLERITNKNLELIDFLQRAVGYSLTGSTREQCLFFLYGLGANGKTTFLEILKTLLGDYGQQTTSETFMAKKQGGQIPNDVAALKGARLVVAVEVEVGRRLAEVLVKELTGGDRVAARFLHQEWFNFKPDLKLWLAANHKPVIRGTDDAIWRRIRLIPFTVQIPEPEQDKDLAEKLKAELPGILNWAIDGCLNWQDYGLAPPQKVQDATQNYRQEMDTLADFLAECCIVAPGASALSSELYTAYTTWTEKTGEKRPLSQRDFGLNLTERGFEGKRGTGGKAVRHGIGLRV